MSIMETALQASMAELAQHCMSSTYQQNTLDPTVQSFFHWVVFTEHKAVHGTSPTFNEELMLWYVELRNGKRMVWATVALSAPDQLRQRMAWALAQVLVVNEKAIALEE